MAEIKLNSGHIAIVDEWDVDQLKAHKWRISNGGDVSTSKLMPNGLRKTIYMRNVVAGLENGNVDSAEHINKNNLDHRLLNLRVWACANAQSKFKLSPLKTSSYVGVSYHNNSKKWMATLADNGKLRRLGLFDDELEAYKCYAMAEYRLHGGNAMLGYGVDIHRIFASDLVDSKK